MKKIILILFLAELFHLRSFAAPGDTTWVTVWNLRKLTQYGNIDTTAVFPTGKRYRKIRMHYILGRYACPGAPQYCGSWDYTTQIHALPTGKDTVEIGRVITPFASDWLQQNKKHDYIVDVTDYASVLDGSTGMRFDYEGYSWGFTITLKFEFIEGIPPMDAHSVENIYDGYFAYGNNANPIENYLTAKTLSYTAPTGMPFIKNSISGHGADATGCSEFCNKYYNLKIDGSQIAQRQIWRNDCGINHVYPQTGTWVFDRSNWCPGAVVWPIYHDISGITMPNNNFTADIDLQPYAVANPSGGYNFVSQLINYGLINQQIDVSIEDIVAPSSDPNYFRSNVACSNPIVKIKNTGSDSIREIVFEYGLSGLTLSTYTWTGSLGFMQETDVVFPSSPSIMSGSVAAAFEVHALTVNGGTDGNADNNVYHSIRRPVQIFPQNFIVKMATNGSVTGPTQISETSWKLYDANDQLIYARVNNSPNTIYQNTVNLQPGCYKFVIEDEGCNGFSWWANPNAGNGSLRFDYTNNVSTITMFPGDIGCNSITQFYVGDLPAPPPPPNPVALNELLPDRAIEIYPNPASDLVYLKFDLPQSSDVSYSVFDVNGKVVAGKQLNNVSLTNTTLNTASLSNGVYFVTIYVPGQPALTKKLLVQH